MSALISTDGLFVAPAGNDPLTTDEFSLLFSSNFASLRKIGSGAFIFGGGYDGSNASKITNGELPISHFVPYANGITYSNPRPFVAAVASASDYSLHFAYRDTGGNIQTFDKTGYVSLNSNWIAAPTFEYVYPGFPTGVGWGAVKFTFRVDPTGVMFFTTNKTSVSTVKYLMFDPSNAV